MDRRGTAPTAGVADDARLVWQLFSPSARLLKCAVRKVNGHFELFVANGREEIVTSAAQELESLHSRAVDWRIALEAQGYVPSADVIGVPARTPQSEPRAAFRGLLECADVLALADRDAAIDLREHATAGLVAVGLDDQRMTREILDLSREALARVRSDREDLAPLLRSCQTLLARIENTLRPLPPEELNH